VVVYESAGANAVEAGGDGWVDAETFFDDCEKVGEGLGAICVDEGRT